MSFTTPPVVTFQNPEINAEENLNKLVFDQTVLIQPTLSFLDAYAVMPSDNGTAVAVGADVSFNRIAATSAYDITATTASRFTLGPIGVYQVDFNVPFDGSGQLVLTLNNVQLAQTVVGKLATGYVSGSYIIATTAVNSIVTVRNPTGNPTALTISTSLGGTLPVSAHLVITRLR